MTVLLVRPKHKLLSSIDKFKASQLDVVGMAVIEVVADIEACKQLTNVLSECNHIGIFVSTVAAQLATQHCNHLNEKLEVGCFAVGASTATILQKAGLSARCPVEETTEGLLSLAELNAVSERKIAIFKGHGGRPELAAELRKRHAKVIELPLYYRKQLHSPYIMGKWQPDKIQCIIVTSMEQADTLIQTLDAQIYLAVPWIVVSERIADKVRKYGVTHTEISNGADDKSLIATVIKVLER